MVGVPSGFNPHQPVKAGASPPPVSGSPPRRVSILTSPLRLVLPGMYAMTHIRTVSILTSPLRLVLRRPDRPGCSSRSGFNPHQPVKAGASRILRHRRRNRSFNPHQPVKAGASICAECVGIAKGVSILTSPLRLVLRAACVRQFERGAGFNPHQPVKAGAS